MQIVWSILYNKQIKATVCLSKLYYMIYIQLRVVKVSMPQFEISSWNFNLGQNVVAPILNWGRSQLGVQHNDLWTWIGLYDNLIRSTIQSQRICECTHWYPRTPFFLTSTCTLWCKYQIKLKINHFLLLLLQAVQLNFNIAPSFIWTTIKNMKLSFKST